MSAVLAPTKSEPIVKRNQRHADKQPDVKTVAAHWLTRWYVIVSILLVIAGVVARIDASQTPNPTPNPMPTMPSPNARDTFDAAEAMIKDVGLVSYTYDVRTIPGKSPNSAVVKSPLSGYHVFTKPEIQHLVVENEPALVKLREGFTQQYMAPQTRSFSAANSWVAGDISMRRVIELDAKYRELEGDWAGAVNDDLDMIQFGVQTVKGSQLIGDMVGMSTQAEGRKQALKDGILDHLNAAQAIAAARRLAAIDKQTVPVAEVFQETKWGTQASILQLVHRRNWRQTLLGDEGVQWGTTTFPMPTVRQISVDLTSSRTAYSDYSKFMDAEIAASKLPWREFTVTRIPQPDDPISNDMVVDSILPDIVDRHTGSLVLNELLEAQLGLRAYYLEHNAYPAKLEQLVPRYLPSAPMDPFSDGEPLRYMQSGSNYTLYSVGPDSVDNHAKPIDNFDGVDHISNDMRYDPLSNVSAKGDIVAGVNY